MFQTTNQAAFTAVEQPFPLCRDHVWSPAISQGLAIQLRIANPWQPGRTVNSKINSGEVWKTSWRCKKCLNLHTTYECVKRKTHPESWTQPQFNAEGWTSVSGLCVFLDLSRMRLHKEYHRISANRNIMKLPLSSTFHFPILNYFQNLPENLTLVRRPFFRVKFSTSVSHWGTQKVAPGNYGEITICHYNSVYIYIHTYWLVVSTPLKNMI